MNPDNPNLRSFWRTMKIKWEQVKWIWKLERFKAMKDVRRQKAEFLKELKSIRGE